MPCTEISKSLKNGYPPRRKAGIFVDSRRRIVRCGPTTTAAIVPHKSNPAKTAALVSMAPKSRFIHNRSNLRHFRELPASPASRNYLVVSKLFPSLGRLPRNYSGLFAVRRCQSAGVCARPSSRLCLTSHAVLTSPVSRNPRPPSFGRLIPLGLLLLRPVRLFRLVRFWLVRVFR